MTTMGLRPCRRAFSTTNFVCESGPSLASTRRIAPSTIPRILQQNARHHSKGSVLYIWQGISDYSASQFIECSTYIKWLELAGIFVAFTWAEKLTFWRKNCTVAIVIFHWPQLQSCTMKNPSQDCETSTVIANNWHHTELQYVRIQHTLTISVWLFIHCCS